MKVEQGLWTQSQGLALHNNEGLGDKAQLVFYFGCRLLIEKYPIYETLKSAYPHAEIVGCSTGGEIIGNEVGDETLVFAAIYFEKSQVKSAFVEITNSDESYAKGRVLGEKLASEGLVGVIVFSKGLEVNGSELTRGLREAVGKSVPVSGGLAGDGFRFEYTLVGSNQHLTRNHVVAVGLYGHSIEFATGTSDGWSEFGPERVITRSEGNVLYELDNKPALDLYKKYLGDEADNMPGSLLYFPLAIWPQGSDSDAYVIRTALDVNEADQSLTFVGDVPEGYSSRFMWGKFDSVTEGAGKAANESIRDNFKDYTSFSLLVSCLGRKALMGQRVVDEIELAGRVLGSNNHRLGFYSYGEIAPHSQRGESVLHNETMTIATIYEK